MRSLFDLERADLSELLDDQPKYRIEQVWDGLHQHHKTVDELSNVPRTIRDRLIAEAPEALTEVARSTSDNGETIKWLWQLHDGSQVETVLMLYPDRATVCVSSQAGCAMACDFCATGQAGFDRNLTSGEIIEQVVRAARASGDRRVSNVVFMGMGEPMANLDNSWRAIERIHDDMGLSARSLTLSTVGIVPGIKRLTDFDLPVTLAVSLHAANDTLRSRMIPINKRYPLAMLTDALVAYREKRRRRISFEWAMIDGVNDRASDARELAAICEAVRAHVNLIPLNATPDYPVQGSSPATIRQFSEQLADLGVNATVRNTRGAEIDAACGQLAFRNRDEATVEMTVKADR